MGQKKGLPLQPLAHEVDTKPLSAIEYRYNFSHHLVFCTVFGMGPNADREINKLMIFYLLENFLATKMTKIVFTVSQKIP